MIKADLVSKARLMEAYIKYVYRKSSEDLEYESNIISYLESVLSSLTGIKASLKGQMERGLRTSSFNLYSSKDDHVTGSARLSTKANLPSPSGIDTYKQGGRVPSREQHHKIRQSRLHDTVIEPVASREKDRTKNTLSKPIKTVICFNKGELNSTTDNFLANFKNPHNSAEMTKSTRNKKTSPELNTYMKSFSKEKSNDFISSSGQNIIMNSALNNSKNISIDNTAKNIVMSSFDFENQGSAKEKLGNALRSLLPKPNPPKLASSTGANENNISKPALSRTQFVSLLSPHKGSQDLQTITLNKVPSKGPNPAFIQKVDYIPGDNSQFLAETVPAESRDRSKDHRETPPQKIAGLSKVMSQRATESATPQIPESTSEDVQKGISKKDKDVTGTPEVDVPEGMKNLNESPIHGPKKTKNFKAVINLNLEIPEDIPKSRDPSIRDIGKAKNTNLKLISPTVADVAGKGGFLHKLLKK